MNMDHQRSPGAKRKLFSPFTSPSVSPRHSYLSSTIAEGDAVRLNKGQSVYVYSEDEAWMEAMVLAVDSTHSLVTVKIQNSGKVTSFNTDDVLLCWENAVDELNNLTNVTPVHEATILSCLHKRFELGYYYTNAGNTVVAVNPFCDVSHLYSIKQIRAYHNKKQGLPPHIYPVAENAYTNLVRDLGHANQSIIISGESGAGKTVSAKHLLRYLTIVTNPAAEKLSLDKGLQIEQRVIDSNPILEAFGNAATTRNDNSSRFGKFIELQFLRMGQIKGGAIETYLLEKTRVMHQGQGENNFHVFYQMTGVREGAAGYPGWVKVMLRDLVDTTFLCVPHNQVCHENADLKETLDAMTRIGLCEETQQQVFQILVAILYLGNLQFVQARDDDSSALDGSPNSSFQSGCQDFTEMSVTGHALNRSCQLLGLSADHLQQTLLHRSLQAGGRHRQSVYVKPIGMAEARGRRDVLAMLLYSRLFEWLVAFINSQIKSEVFDNVIGLLDIYGFEIFATNSLEQLCINYANERLQQHYVAHFLRNLQNEYAEECLPWVPVDYNDNRPCVRILDGQVSVFSLLNEEVYLNRKSDDEALKQKLMKLADKSDSCLLWERFSSSDSPSFVIQHYAGMVQYSIADLVAKNKDDVPADLVSLLTASHNPFLQDLFSSYVEPESPTGRKKRTVLTKFKSSLDDLMSSLSRSDVHYIRCLRPNVQNAPQIFQAPYVLHQLRACGTIESVDICRKGYPARMPYKEFQQRYGIILKSEYRLGVDSVNTEPEPVDDNDNEKEDKENVCDPLQTLLQQQLSFPLTPNRSPTPRKKLKQENNLTENDRTRQVCTTVLQAVCGTDGVDPQRQFGRTKLFLTEQQLEQLESARLRVLHHSAVCLQSLWRGLFCRRRYALRLAARKICRAWLTFQTRRQFLCLRRAAIVVQRAWLTVRTRRRFLCLRKAAIVVQRAWITCQMRTDFLRLKRAAVVVERAWLTLRTRRDYVRLKRAIIVIQNGIRHWLHRRHPQNHRHRDKEEKDLWHQNHQVLRVKEKPTRPEPAIRLYSMPPDITLSRVSTHIMLESLDPASDLSEPWPAFDDNMSDDSGVMVHEPVKCWESITKEGRRLSRKGREVLEGSLQRLLALVSVLPRLQGMHVGDGVITRQRIPKTCVRFHTRASVLRHGHVINRRELPFGLSDLLTEVPYGGQGVGSSVDP